uniref:Uncharacterized protein n=1 Tax=Arundo donax TaxID=35708 RepID=A0A0A9F8I1_ARUDO
MFSSFYHNFQCLLFHTNISAYVFHSFFMSLIWLYLLQSYVEGEQNFFNLHMQYLLL